jgi:hydroxymethylpyrimidine pyrophosphatase-like HAD family hydrolase
MYCRVLACDFDGTGAVDGRLSPEVAEALGAAREREDLAIANVDLAAFDAVVAENGAVVRLPPRDQTIRIEFLRHVRDRYV